MKAAGLRASGLRRPRGEVAPRPAPAGDLPSGKVDAGAGAVIDLPVRVNPRSWLLQAIGCAVLAGLGAALVLAALVLLAGVVAPTGARVGARAPLQVCGPMVAAAGPRCPGLPERLVEAG